MSDKNDKTLSKGDKDLTNKEKSIENVIISDTKDNKRPTSRSKSNNRFIDEKNNTKMNSGKQISMLDNQMEQKKKTVSKNKKSNYISEGDLLEYRLKRLIFFMGYYPQVGVIIKSSTNEQADTITDLDVYGTYIHKNFASKTIWADCKSGRARPLERISWINGVKDIVGIEDVIFVKKGVRMATKQFARKSRIQILDLEVINKLERDYKINTTDWRGSWNPRTQLNQLIKFQNIDVPTKDRFKKIGNFISCSYWTVDDYLKVKRTLTALNQLSEVMQYPLQQQQMESVHWAIYKLVNLFVLATLNICRDLYYYSDRDKEETILQGLISGEISMKKRAEIVDATYKVAYGIILQHVPNFEGTLKVPNIGGSPPKYFEAFNNLILRITNNPLDYFDILRFLDFILMEYDLQSKDINEEHAKAMFPNYEDLVTSAKTILYFICSITNIRKNVFQLIRGYK
ncbi:MAG: hypothetical protein N4A64_10830 [Marinisporobacter sp.]|jgi:hypothetical protein|nr:hypothetical protein [Marinisporobacter sp.]